MWFEELFGFKEESPDQVRAAIMLENDTIMSRINGKSYHCGSLEIPSLGELRSTGQPHDADGKRLTLKEIIDDAGRLHRETSNEHSLFQVASQFNLLEMVNHDVTPEQGITGYFYDKTQGPACALAAAAGTLYRNYFVPVNGCMGQSEHNQIDCLADWGEAPGNDGNRLWKMKNGYALFPEKGLNELDRKIL